LIARGGGVAVDLRVARYNQLRDSRGGKIGKSVKVILPFAISVARVEVLVTVKFAMVEVARVAMLVNCTAPLAIKVFNVDVFVTVRF